VLDEAHEAAPAGSCGLEKAAIAAHSMTTADAGAKKMIRVGRWALLVRTHLPPVLARTHLPLVLVRTHLRWSTASRAPSVGGATRKAPPARALDRPLDLVGATTGRRLKARSHAAP